MKTLTAQLRKVQQRLGMRQELVAGIALASLAVGAVSFTLTARVGTPAAAALAYMAAVDRADTDYVWSHSIVDSAPTAPATISFVNRAGLAAQLKASAHTRSRLDVQGVGFVSSGTKVTLTYDTSGGRASISLVMRGGAPHSWPVLLEPAGLEINLPAGAGVVAIDGQPIDSTTSGDIKVAVLPGHHILFLGASRLFEAYTGDLDAESQLPSLTRVDLSKVKLTDEAVADAKQATSNAIKNCAGATVLNPEGCPQALTGDLASGGTRWIVLGDPLADASMGLGDKADFQVTGHYLMRLTYDSAREHGTRVLAVGGPYVADLKWDGQAMAVTGFAAAPVATPIPQPAATDAQILAALKSQFDSCLTLQAGSSDGCPQQVFALDASNFVWHANSDPLRGAAVEWDSRQGFYKVGGNFDFSVDYDSTPPYSPTRHYQDHSSGEYTADLYWDGSKVVFVGFE
jgi:hypothetical protein